MGGGLSAEKLEDLVCDGRLGDGSCRGGLEGGFEILVGNVVVEVLYDRGDYVWKVK